MKLYLRDATLNDLEALTRIAIAVLPQEPQELYQYPGTNKDPEEVYEYTKQEMKRFIQDRYDQWEYKVMLCERESGDGKEIIAFSVWEISALKGREAVSEEHGSITKAGRIAAGKQCSSMIRAKRSGAGKQTHPR